MQSLLLKLSPVSHCALWTSPGASRQHLHTPTTSRGGTCTAFNPSPRDYKCLNPTISRLPHSISSPTDISVAGLPEPEAARGTKQGPHKSHPHCQVADDLQGFVWSGTERPLLIPTRRMRPKHKSVPDSLVRILSYLQPHLRGPGHSIALSITSKDALRFICEQRRTPFIQLAFP